MPRNRPSKQANIWTARIIPVFLLAIIVYASWVVTQLVCVDYLVNPQPSVFAHRRVGAAIVILIVYYLLLLLMLISYGRLIYTIVANPGFVPRGAHFADRKTKQEEPGRESRHRTRRSKIRSLDEKQSISRTSVGDRDPVADIEYPGVDEFWLRDVFVCNYDGRPAFCSACGNFKPDRTHHCSEVDRCVRKMDHFCPWVGGIISETSFKFFLQFCFYSAVFCTHGLVFMAYYFAQRRAQENFIDVHWVLTLAFAALFLLFSAGMFASSLQLASLNSTTVENLVRKSKVYYLAVWMPRPDEVIRNIESKDGKALRLITYPRPPEERQMLLQGDGVAASESQATEGQPRKTAINRTFAILESPRGFNPWDCGAFQNIQEVLGYSLLEWLTPVKLSPCAIHASSESMFKLGPQVEWLKKEAGLVLRENATDGPRMTSREKRRKRTTHRDSVQKNEDSQDSSPIERRLRQPPHNMEVRRQG